MIKLGEKFYEKQNKYRVRKIWDEGGQRVSSGKRGSGVVLLVKPMK